MNFFKSILSDDPDPQIMNNYTNNNQQTENERTNSNSTFSSEASGTDAGLWSFGDLVKTITTKSESVLETYRRDLKEFGSGLKKESDLFREVGSSAIDVVIKSTKGVVLEPEDVNDSESVRNSRMYNRYDSQLNVIQSDVRTYCEEPEDVDEYNKWKLGFVVEEKESEIEKLIGSESENGTVEAIYRRVVPNEVDEGSFWCRYFYKVYKLKQQEEIRASFMRRSLSVDDEEELSWDVDDDDEKKESDLREIETNVVDEKIEKNNVCNEKVDSVLKTEGIIDGSKNVGEGGFDNVDEKFELVRKTDENDEVKLQEDDDLEWDEIGDIGETNETSVIQGERAKRGEVIKRLNTDEDDEDLSWDIEDDDDEPVKAGGNK